MTTLGIGGIHAGGAGIGGVSFELKGALQVSRHLAVLGRELPLYERRAIGTMRRKLPTQARRDIQREYAITASRLNRGLRVSNINGGLRLTGYFRGVGLRNFGARQTRAGVSAAIFRGKRSLREHAFFAPLLGGADGSNRHVVKREGEPRVMTRGRYAGKRRQPIVVQYGPTAAQMLRKGDRPQRLADFAFGVLRQEMERQVVGWYRRRTGATA